MIVDGGKSVLEIRNIVSQDTGVYTCKATSDLGEAVTSTTLFVEGKTNNYNDYCVKMKNTHAR